MADLTTAADYATEPGFGQRFKPSRAKEIIASVLRAKLTGATYHADNTSAWAKEIADEVKAKLKEEKWPRYKYVVQVFVGEQRGEGVRLGSRCVWDQHTDDFAFDTFKNEGLFAVAAAYGIYLY